MGYWLPRCPIIASGLVTSKRGSVDGYIIPESARKFWRPSGLSAKCVKFGYFGFCENCDYKIAKNSALNLHK